MRLARDGGRGEEAVGEALARSAGEGGAFLGDVTRVARDHLHEAAHLAELDHVAAHHERVDEALAQAARAVDREVVRLVELLGSELEPDALFLLVEREEAFQLLRIADHGGECARVRDRGRGLGRSGKRRGQRHRRGRAVGRLPVRGRRGGRRRGLLLRECGRGNRQGDGEGESGESFDFHAGSCSTVLPGCGATGDAQRPRRLCGWAWAISTST